MKKNVEQPQNVRLVKNVLKKWNLLQKFNKCDIREPHFVTLVLALYKTMPSGYHKEQKIWNIEASWINTGLHQLATVKNSAVNVVFPILLIVELPNLSFPNT